MHLLHDINPLKGRTYIRGIVEIPKNSRIKYELNEELGIIEVSRVLRGPARYPINYGFIPRTMGKDKDPLDIIIFSRESFYPSALVSARPIGVFPLFTDGAKDYKIIAVPAHDPDFSKIRSLCGIPTALLEELKEFMLTYKNLEGEKTKLGKFSGKTAAWNIIRRSLRAYREKMKNPAS